MAQSVDRPRCGSTFIPLRNILPGAPPPGVWVDQAVVLWVLITLVTAMVIYFIGWHRDAE